ncbi:M20 family metallopeptidase [Geomicrobium sp. JCM 19055]|uniref:M20 metallopeptidase family protein n=1 Tax=Geomicrobium sp. JCM 19055 TaxID=1460649 RepID=UPI00045ED59C|nr:amidohydrolase [Geomicrobium sp. JCM 19055]GAJ98246.1 p-aminobenzoyl-glutamate hydrolase subunit A [Geomicrobium sp. JCM 19055]
MTTLQDVFPKIVEWRRHLHMHPELSFEEVATPEYIAEKLESLGLEVTTHVGGRGVVAKLQGKHNGPTIAFRADFDALPIEEENDTEYVSKNPGVMHACGHDGHTAALLGAATILTESKDQLSGTIVFIFQHAEELPPGGAKEMIADGCLDGVDYIFGAHVQSGLSLGQVNVRQGPSMAAVDRFKIRIQGKGGHGAMPHTTVDSIVAGSKLVLDLQQIVARRIDPMDNAVVTVGVFEAGKAFNVIADSSTIQGTVRTFKPETRKQIEEDIRGIVRGLEASNHVTCDIDYLNGYPALVNHAEETALVGSLIQETFGEDAWIQGEPVLGGEDFAYYLEEKPGCFFHVGSQTEEEWTTFPHHHPRFDFDERALLNIGELFLKIAHHYVVAK